MTSMVERTAVCVTLLCFAAVVCLGSVSQAVPVANPAVVISHSPYPPPEDPPLKLAHSPYPPPEDPPLKLAHSPYPPPEDPPGRG